MYKTSHSTGHEECVLDIERKVVLWNYHDCRCCNTLTVLVLISGVSWLQVAPGWLSIHAGGIKGALTDASIRSFLFWQDMKLVPGTTAEVGQGRQKKEILSQGSPLTWSQSPFLAFMQIQKTGPNNEMWRKVGVKVVQGTQTWNAQEGCEKVLWKGNGLQQ